MSKYQWLVIVVLISCMIPFTGCEREDSDRLASVEQELSTVKIELANAQRDLSDCESKSEGFGSLKLTNDHPTLTIWEVYIAPSSDSFWGPDLTFEFGIIVSGNSCQYPLVPGTYGVRVIFENGQEFIEEVTIRAGEENEIGWE